MKLPFSTVLIGHYANDQLASMQRFDALLVEQLRTHGNDEFNHRKWTPPVVFGRLKRSAEGVGKWLGYIDKFILFPILVQYRILAEIRDPERTLFILPDHSHGIYIHLFRHWPHVVHVHDLIAIRMAQNAFYGQTLNLSGKIYQQCISKGLKTAKHFICISKASKADLLRFVSPTPAICKVVYLELNYPYAPISRGSSVKHNKDPKIAHLSHPFFLHVGNRLWYKNREGVIRIFNHLLQLGNTYPMFDLVIVGEAPTEKDAAMIEELHLEHRIHFLSHIDSDSLALLYSRTIGLLFPSHYEGFGWPIIEAFACGCPVLTTHRPPMTEVGGSLADYIEPMPIDASKEGLQRWLDSASERVKSWLSADEESKTKASQARVVYSRQFEVGSAFRQYLAIYQSIPNSEPVCVS